MYRQLVPLNKKSLLLVTCLSFMVMDSKAEVLQDKSQCLDVNQDTRIALPLPPEQLATVKLLEQPHHGKLRKLDTEESWEYVFTDNYFGRTIQDRVVFQYEQAGQAGKLIVNLLVDPTLEDQTQPACEKMDFNFDVISLRAVGDIMLGGKPLPLLQAKGYDYPFEKIKPDLQADIVFGNLEGSLTFKGSPEPDKPFVFRTPPSKVSMALKKAGFNLLGLANNHTYDYGINGIFDTQSALDAAGIAYAGAGINLREARRPALLDIKGQRIALLSYCVIIPESYYATDTSPGIAFADEATLKEDIASARKEADIVLVAMHWGREGTQELLDYQRKLGHIAIESGAAAVLGSHPHVLQAVERYKDGIIFYSLGNFTFGAYSKTSRVSAVASLAIEFGRVSTASLLPINVNNFEVQLQPRRLAGKQADAVVNLLQATSLLENTKIINKKGVAMVVMSP